MHVTTRDTGVQRPDPDKPARGIPEALYPLLNLFQGVFLAVWTAFWITLAAVFTLLTLNRNVALAMARRIWAPTLVRGPGGRFLLEPLPDVDWSKPHIFVMNHQSMMDIPCAFAAIPANLRFVAKDELKYVPFLGWYMWMTGMIFITRPSGGGGANRMKAVRSLKLAGERIRAGSNILAFPEGTRSSDGAILPFKKGSFVLALEAGVPIIPVAIEGTGKVLPPNSFRVRPGDVRMKIGEPIPTAGRTRREKDALLIEVREVLGRMHQEIGGKGATGEAIADAEG